MRELHRLFWPFLLSMVAFRLMQQTDVIMLSWIDSNAVIALGIVLRVSIIDTVIALALGPIVSVRIAKNRQNRKFECQQALATTTLLALSCTALSCFLYPFIVQNLSSNVATRILAQQALWWFIPLIPIKMLHLTTSLSLHAVKAGKLVMWIQVFSLIANGLLNYVFTIYAEYGVVGIWFATVLVTLLSFAFSLYALSKNIPGSIKFTYLQLTWFRSFTSQLASESARIAGERLLAFALMGLCVSSSLQSSLQSSYIIGEELLFLIMAPTIALMRSVAIGNFKLEAKILLPPVFIAIVFGTVMFILRNTIAKELYQLTGESARWLKILLGIVPILLVTKVLDAFLRGILYGQQNIAYMLKTDMILGWCVLLPLIALGFYTREPWLIWGGYLISALGSVLLLSKGQRLRLPSLAKDGV